MFENRELRRGSGENVRELCQRVSEFIEEKVRGLSAPVLLVGHGVTNRALLNVLLPEKREELMSVRIDNCSIWRVEGKNYEKVFSPNLA